LRLSSSRHHCVAARPQGQFELSAVLLAQPGGRFPGLDRLRFSFEPDHFLLQALNPQSRRDYLNLVYACRRCNAFKGDQKVADPFERLRANLVTTLPDGSLQPRDRDAQRLVRQLDLNSPRLKSWRVMWMRIAVLAEGHDTELYFRLVGFPEDLPNLGRLKPPRNSRREGLERCWFARRHRGEPPAVY
jgi:hypothetical protein